MIKKMRSKEALDKLRLKLAGKIPDKALSSKMAELKEKYDNEDTFFTPRWIDFMFQKLTQSESA